MFLQSQLAAQGNCPDGYAKRVVVGVFIVLFQAAQPETGVGVTADAGDDRISGGSGDDLVAGGAGDDRLSGGWGNDILTDGTGDDRTSGGWGHDLIIDAQGNDRHSGGRGDDVMVFTEASLMGREADDRDVFNGGWGYDTLILRVEDASSIEIVEHGNRTYIDALGVTARNVENIVVVEGTDLTGEAFYNDQMATADLWNFL